MRLDQTAKPKPLEFQARVSLVGDEIMERGVWVHELDPMLPLRCSGQEWAEEHLSNYDAEDWREMCKLSPLDDVQVLVRGRISGHWSYYPEEAEEYNEDCTITEVLFQPIPPGWYDAVADHGLFLQTTTQAIPLPPKEKR